ncbi:MAG: DUF2484 family protein [Rhodobacteraceae bacterium]|nr:DUF2484 family protein [Paracoccaceae bacterium]
MNTAIILAAVWIVTGTIVALMPRRFHPRFAIPLLAAAVLLVPYLWIAGNPFLAVMFGLGVGSILRWPFFYITRMVLRQVGVNVEKDRFEASGYRMMDRKSSKNGGRRC